MNQSLTINQRAFEQAMSLEFDGRWEEAAAAWLETGRPDAKKQSEMCASIGRAVEKNLEFIAKKKPISQIPPNLFTQNT